jgi:hypothetical protein
VVRCKGLVFNCLTVYCLDSYCLDCCALPPSTVRSAGFDANLFAMPAVYTHIHINGCTRSLSLPLYWFVSRANLQRLLAAIQPNPYVQEPPDAWRVPVFRWVKHPAFEVTVVGTIVVNTLFMALEHYGQSSR